MSKIMDELRNEAYKEGKKEGLEEAALLMLQAGKCDLDEVVTILGFTPDEAKKLEAGRNS